MQPFDYTAANRPLATPGSKLSAAALAIGLPLINLGMSMMVYGTAFGQLDPVVSGFATLLVSAAMVGGLLFWIQEETKSYDYYPYRANAYVRWWARHFSLIMACSHAAVGVLAGVHPLAWTAMALLSMLPIWAVEYFYPAIQPAKLRPLPAPVALRDEPVTPDDTTAAPSAQRRYDIWE